MTVSVCVSACRHSRPTWTCLSSASPYHNDTNRACRLSRTLFWSRGFACAAFRTNFVPYSCLVGSSTSAPQTARSTPGASTSCTDTSRCCTASSLTLSPDLLGLRSRRRGNSLGSNRGGMRPSTYTHPRPPRRSVPIRDPPVCFWGGRGEFARQCQTQKKRFFVFPSPLPRAWRFSLSSRAPTVKNHASLSNELGDVPIAARLVILSAVAKALSGSSQYFHFSFSLWSATPIRARSGVSGYRRRPRGVELAYT